MGEKKKTIKSVGGKGVAMSKTDKVWVGSL